MDNLKDAATAVSYWEDERFQKYELGEQNFEDLHENLVAMRKTLLEISYLLQRGQYEAAKTLAYRETDMTIEMYHYYLSEFLKEPDQED